MGIADMLASPDMSTMFSPPTNNEPSTAEKRLALATIGSTNGQALKRTPRTKVRELKRLAAVAASKIAVVEAAKPLVLKEEETAENDEWSVARHFLPSPAMATMFSPLTASARPADVRPSKKVVRYSRPSAPVRDVTVPLGFPYSPQTPTEPAALPTPAPTDDELFSPGAWDPDEHDETSTIEQQAPPGLQQKLASGVSLVGLIICVALATALVHFPEARGAVEPPLMTSAHPLRKSLDLVLADVWTF